MKTLQNQLHARCKKETIKFGECNSPYARENIALLKKYKRQSGKLDCKTMWKDIEEDVAKYVVNGEVAEHPKSPWDITFMSEGKQQFWEVRSLHFENNTGGVNFACSSDHATKDTDSDLVRLALERKWGEVHGYFIVDSAEYAEQGRFRFWQIPVRVIEQLYYNDEWAEVQMGKVGAEWWKKLPQWSVKRSTNCFKITMNKIFNKQQTQIYF